MSTPTSTTLNSRRFTQGPADGPGNRLGKRPAASRRFDTGFTLIEVLVVVVIVAVMAATVAISLTGNDRNRRLQVDVQRLSGLLEMVRMQALQRNEEWGVFVDENTLSFASFDEQSDEWVAYNTRPLQEVSFDDLRFELYVDNQLELPDRFDEDEVPDLLFFSSGESMKYDLRIEPDWEADAWTISSDGLSRPEGKREETSRR